MTEGHHRKNLFICETFYSLMNILVIIHETQEKQIPSDILFTEASDFSKIIPKIQKSGLFHNTFYMQDSKKRIAEINQMDMQEKEQVAKDPRLYLEDVGLANDYTDLWVALDKMFSKLLYYCLIKNKSQPAIHIYEEGLGTYLQTFQIPTYDYIPHSVVYKEKSFYCNIADIYLYEPALYLGNTLGVPVKSLPRTGFQKEDFKQFLCDIFGTIQLPPNRPIIFFEECMTGDGRMVNDIDLLYELESLVGRENIAVKRHPRNAVDRLSKLGFYVMENATIPWEIILLTNDVSNKLFVSIASTTCFSSMITYEKKAKAILLKSMLVGRVPFLDATEFQKFLDKSTQLFNQDELCIYQPQSVEELAEIIKFLDFYNTENKN